MAELRRIPISDIHVGERQRPIDHDHAAAIAASMEERGLINPITVRRTPRQNSGRTPWTLVAGGHRLVGAGKIGWTEIDVLVVAADAAEAVLIELSENLYRNDLTALNRVMFVSKFRETWQDTHGPIKSGRPKKSGTECPILFIGGQTVSKQVQARLGIGGTYYKVITRVALGLHSDLREAVRGTEAETDMAKLKKLAKLDRDLQLKIAAVLKEGGDLKTALKWAQPDKGRQERKPWNMDRFTSAWHLMSEAEKDQALSAIGAIRKPVDRFAPIPEGPRAFVMSADATVPVTVPLSSVPARNNISPLREFCEKPFADRVRPISYGEILNAQRLESDAQMELAMRINDLEKKRWDMLKAEREQPKLDRRRLTKIQKEAIARDEKKTRGQNRKIQATLSGYFNHDIASTLVAWMVRNNGQAWLPLPTNWKAFYKAGGKLSQAQLDELLHNLRLVEVDPDNPLDFLRRVRGMIHDWEDEQGVNLDLDEEEDDENETGSAWG